MHIFAMYHEDGSIDGLLKVAVPEHAHAQGGNMVECGEDVNQSNHFVDAPDNGPPIVRERVPQDVSHSVDGLSVTFPSLEESTLIEAAGSSLLTDAASTVVNFDIPGTYIIHLSGHVRYLDHELEVAVGNA